MRILIGSLLLALILTGAWLFAQAANGINPTPPPPVIAIVADHPSVISGGIDMSIPAVAALAESQTRVAQLQQAGDQTTVMLAQATLAAAQAEFARATADAAFAQSQASFATEAAVASWATDSAALATTQAVAVAQATSDYYLQITVDAQRSYDQLVLEQTRAAIDAGATRDAQAVAIAAADATRTAVAAEEANVLRLESIALERQRAERTESMRQTAVYAMIGLLSLVLLAAIAGAFFYVWLRREQFRPYVVVAMPGGATRLLVNRGDQGYQVIDQQPALVPDTVIDAVPEDNHGPRVGARAAEPPFGAAGQQAQSAAVAYLDRAKCILICGPQDTGKTSFASHLIERRPATVVVDPKPRTAWPDHATVVGRGYDWAAMSQQLHACVDEMTRRYQRMLTDDDYEPDDLHLVVDEWPSLAATLSDAAGLLKRLIFEGREAGIRVTIITQSDDVTTLGIRGQGKLREAFVLAYLSRDVRGQRAVRVTWGNSERTFAHPGPYMPRSQPAQAGTPAADAGAERRAQPNLDWMDDMPATMRPQRVQVAATTAIDVMEPIVLRHYPVATSLADLERRAYRLREDVAVGGTRYYTIKAVLQRNNLPDPRTDLSHAACLNTHVDTRASA